MPKQRVVGACWVLCFLLVAGACSNSVTRVERALPVPVLSPGEIEGLESAALEFVDIYWGSWPGIDRALGRFADEMVFYDPADGDFIIEGGSRMAQTMRSFAKAFADVEPTVDEVFISREGVAFRVTTPSGYWPPWVEEPEDHLPVVGLDALGFNGDEVVSYDVWFEGNTMVMLGFGCFADGCAQGVPMVADYLDAWTSGDEERIIALYAEDATFVDSVMGLDAEGPEAIARLAAARFGGPEPVWALVDTYFQTDGPHPPSDLVPDRGEVIAVGIHYLIGDGATTQESLTLFEMGTRRGSEFANHPQGLITREQVFHVVDDWLLNLTTDD